MGWIASDGACVLWIVGSDAGYGFADLIHIPKPEYQNSHPALLIELKWNKNTETAITQIKEKKYPESIEEYTGDILLVGISYDKKTKVHECVIEKYRKEWVAWYLHFKIFNRFTRLA